MSEGIKKMLAERAEAKAGDKKNTAKWDQLTTRTLEMIERAAPFMDEGFDGTGWKPSEKLKITFFAAATSGRLDAEKDALMFLQKMLGRARRLWVNGLHPDPWTETPLLRHSRAVPKADAQGESA